MTRRKAVHTSNCVQCHGADGNGTAQNANYATDLSDDFRTELNTEGVLFCKVWNGHSIQLRTEVIDMPAFEGSEGVEFPSLGISQAWNDPAAGVLHVVTYAAAPDKRGTSTRWRVSNLPSVTSLTIRLNGQPFNRFVAVGPRTIELTSTIDAHQFEIVTGYRGDGTRAEAEPPATPRAAASASLLASAEGDGAPAKPNPFAMSRGCPCCPPV